MTEMQKRDLERTKGLNQKQCESYIIEVTMSCDREEAIRWASYFRDLGLESNNLDLATAGYVIARDLQK